MIPSNSPNATSIQHCKQCNRLPEKRMALLFLILSIFLVWNLKIMIHMTNDTFHVRDGDTVTSTANVGRWKDPSTRRSDNAIFLMNLQSIKPNENRTPYHNHHKKQNNKVYQSMPSSTTKDEQVMNKDVTSSVPSLSKLSVVIPKQEHQKERDSNENLSTLQENNDGNIIEELSSVNHTNMKKIQHEEDST